MGHNIKINLINKIYLNNLNSIHNNHNFNLSQALFHRRNFFLNNYHFLSHNLYPKYVSLLKNFPISMAITIINTIIINIITIRNMKANINIITKIISIIMITINIIMIIISIIMITINSITIITLWI